jgi:hypothetical protein
MMNDGASLDAADDDSLIARIALGDADALSTLFRRRCNAVLQFALHMTGVRAIAEDVTQDVFGQAESPDGKADVIDVRGEGDFAARLFIDSESHLPLMLTWQDKEPRKTVSLINGKVYLPDGTETTLPPITDADRASGVGKLPQRRLADDERERLNTFIDGLVKKYDALRKIIEYRMHYADYRDVEGLKLPFRISRAMAGKTVEEWQIDKVKINPKIDPDTFATKK